MALYLFERSLQYLNYCTEAVVIYSVFKKMIWKRLNYILLRLIDHRKHSILSRLPQCELSHRADWSSVQSKIAKVSASGSFML